VVKQQQTTPKKMKTFAETSKGKRVKKKAPEATKESDEEEEKEPPSNDVMAAREALKRKLTNTPQKDKPQTSELVSPEKGGF
jgi:hypothetical protein